MLEQLKEKFYKEQGEILCVELGEKQVELKVYTGEEVRELAAGDLPKYKQNKEMYLKSLADFLREELIWLEKKEELSLSFALKDPPLQLESFNLSPMPRKEEKEAIAWEVNETVGLERGSYYYQVEKLKEKQGEEYVYTIYACEKALVHKLAGMAQGFGLKLLSIVPLEGVTPKNFQKNNLCPPELSFDPMKIKLDNWARLFAYACMSLAILIFGILQIAIFKEEQELEKMRKEIERNGSWQENVRYAVRVQAETRRLNRTITRLGKKKKKQADVLEAVGRSTVPGVWLTSIEEEGAAYKITGRSVDLVGVNAWSEELPISSKFKKVQVLSTDARVVGLSFSARVEEG